MKKGSISDFTKVAILSAKAGGKVLTSHFDKGIKADYKGRIDPVTAADRESQNAVYRVVKSHFPGHSIIGEEDTNPQKCSEYCWIIDPLDGTVNFIHNMKLFSISIALTHKGKTICGVVYAPAIGEMFFSQKGKGSFLNGKRIRVSKINSLVRALCVTGFPYNISTSSARVLRNLKNVVKKAQGIRRLGSAALDLCYIACGRLDVYWEEGLKPWDIAAGELIVKEAGGRMTGYDGKNDYLWKGRVIATNGLLHNKARKLIKE